MSEKYTNDEDGFTFEIIKTNVRVAITFDSVNQELGWCFVDKETCDNGVINKDALKVIRGSLLQELWNEYKKLIQAIDEFTDDTPLDDEVRNLHDAITDTKEMAKLREKLNKAGVSYVS